MKESDITPEVIAKAKEIAEIWRMEIYEGCWVLHGGLVKLVYQKLGQFISVIIGHQKGEFLSGDLIPIPSILDCLKKLDNSPPEIGIHYSGEKYRVNISFDVWGFSEYPRSVSTTSNTLHQALLSALLKVLTKKETK